MKPAKIIKRYANRKLYDTDRSCYVTLDEISQMVKEGDDVQVLDNRTKDDLTAVTLAQIIVEEEKKVAHMPLKLLRSIIQSGNEVMSEFYQRRLADPVLTLREDVERKVEGLFRRDDKSLEDENPMEHEAVPGSPGASGDSSSGVGTPDAPAADEPVVVTEGVAADGPRPASAQEGSERAHPVKEWVSATQEALESFQRRVDEQVKQALARMGPLGTPASEVEGLRERVAELEGRLSELEARAQAASATHSEN